jgi:hypothetical protein
MALFGARVAPSLKLFLTALAIIAASCRNSRCSARHRFLPIGLLAPKTPDS